MTLRTVAARGASATIAGQVSKFLLQAVLLVVLSRLLLPADFGVLAIVMVVVGVAAALTDFGLSLAAIQAPHLDQGQKSNLLWISSFLGVGFGVAAFSASPLLEDFFNRPEVGIVTRALSIIFVLNGIAGQYRADLSRRLLFGSIVVSEVIAALLSSVLAILLAVFGYGYWALVAQQLSLAVVQLAGYIWYSKWVPAAPRRASGMKPLLSFGVQTMFLQGLNFVSANTDNVSLGRFQGPGLLGLYSRAYQVVSIPLQQLVSPLTRVVIPILSRLSEEEERFKSFALRAQLVVSYLLITSLLIIFCGGEELFAVALGERWSESGFVAQILSVGGLFQTVGYSYYWIYMARGRVRDLLLCEVPARICMMVMVVVGASQSIEMAAVGYSAGLLLILVVTSFPLRRTGVHARDVLGVSVLPVFLFLVLGGTSISCRIAMRPYDVSNLERLLITFFSLTIVGAVMLLISARIRKDLSEMFRTLKSITKGAS